MIIPPYMFYDDDDDEINEGKPDDDSEYGCCLFCIFVVFCLGFGGFLLWEILK